MKIFARHLRKRDARLLRRHWASLGVLLFVRPDPSYPRLCALYRQS
jgi:hypothetical protein